MARDSRYTEATKLAQNDMQKVIDSFGEDTPFMSDGVSARTEARRAKLANAPGDIQALSDRFPAYFLERLVDVSENARDKRLPADRGMFVPNVRLDTSQVQFRNPYNANDAGEDARMRKKTVFREGS